MYTKCAGARRPGVIGDHNCLNDIKRTLSLLCRITPGNALDPARFSRSRFLDFIKHFSLNLYFVDSTFPSFSFVPSTRFIFSFFFFFLRNFTTKQFSVVARCLRLLSTRFRVAFTRPVHAILGRFETLTSVDRVNFTLQVTRGISANRLVDGELHASVAVQLDMRATVSAPINCTYAFARATNIERRIKSCADKGFQSWIYHVATVLSSWLR